MIEKMLSAAEVAERLGITQRRVSVLCRNGRFPRAQKVGSFWAIPEGDVNDYRPGKPGRPTQIEEVRNIIRRG